jgi:glyoxylase-like metal-dependent hydrolase (beta-lactamase superfamily II)
MGSGSGGDTGRHAGAGRFPESNTDDYTGAVTVGGPPDVRQVPGLQITKIALGPFDNNCYFLRCTATGEVALIDAAADAPALLRVLGDSELARIVTTHRHPDHVGALPELVEATGAITAAQEEDADHLPVPTRERLHDGDVVTVGAAQLRVIHLSGHTPGGAALLYDAGGRLAATPHLFTGDCLFPGGPGNTQNDPARFTRLMDDLERKVFGPLPDATWIYPGHGADTTLGTERPHLSEWRARGW